MNSLTSRVTAVALTGLFLSPVSNAALTGYSQNFEGLDAGSASALGDDGWEVGANVFAADGTTFLYNYFAFPAPNGSGAFSNVAVGEGGPDQGAQQMVVFNDYNNADHGNTDNRIEANIFQTRNADGTDTGSTWEFSFDAKLGDIGGASTATAFIKTFNSDFSGNPDFVTFDLTSISPDWNTYSLMVTLNDPSIAFVQFGFLNVASNFEPSGTFVDNINFRSAQVIPVPGAVLLLGSGLIGMLGFRRKRS